MKNGRVRLVGLVLAAVAALTGCGTTPATAPAAATGSAATGSPSPAAAAAGASAAPAAAGPSVSAQMICGPEEQGEIAEGLGLTLRRPATPAWTAPVYRCTYLFPAGPLVLSVRELAEAGNTTAYFTAARAAAPGSTELPGLGDAAFAATDGSVYVRKDFKVLTVDVSKLPTSVGTAPIARADAAVVVAQLITAAPPAAGS
jgi:hypothetical protein